jgi:hypothetical protein
VPITDWREIAFDAAATVEAVRCSQRMVQAIGLPAVPPAGARFDPATKKVILLYSVERDPSASRPAYHPVTIQPGPLGALLISYCMRSGIRIPRHQGRSMRVDREAVVLVFTETHPVPPSALAPERAEADNARSRSWMETPADILRRR